MPVEAKPLFRPDVLRGHVDAFDIGALFAPVPSSLLTLRKLFRSLTHNQQTRLPTDSHYAECIMVPMTMACSECDLTIP